MISVSVTLPKVKVDWTDKQVIWGLKGKGGDLPEESTIGQFQSYDPI